MMGKQKAVCFLRKKVSSKFKLKEKEKEEKVETERTYKRPVYRKEHDIPNIGSSYDMPEGW